MYPGVSTQVFGKLPLDAACVRMVRESGFRAVELYGVSPHFDCRDALRLADAAAFFSSEGVNVAAVHAPYLDLAQSSGMKQLSITEGGAERIAAALTHVRAAICAARALHAPIVVVHCGSYNDSFNGVTISNLVSFLNALHDDISDGSVAIALENVASTLSGPGFLSSLLQGYDIDNVGVCVDIGHANIGGDPAAAIVSGGSRILHVHAHDNGGAADDHLLPTQGGIDWPGVMAAIKNSGYDGCFNFEPRPAGDPGVALSECFDIYKNLLEL